LIIILGMLTPKDKAILCNSLIGIVKGCEGKRIQIDLRNELHILGKLESVTSEMNVVMSDAYLTLPYQSKNQKDQIKRHYDEIIIRGCNIRFVHIPDEIDLIKTLHNQIKSVKNGKKDSIKKLSASKR
jgi:small nuclear ribonucleoprotein (snRNP)-like protein